MTINIRRLLPVCGTWLLAASIQAQTLGIVTAQGRPLVQDFPQSSLIIDTSDNTCEHFQIFVASDRTAQARGLMFVREMPDDGVPRRHARRLNNDQLLSSYAA